tara:strand:- start:60001 stop:61500 length:1500 start_codon:yes stop_codon:yes gene_type:complete
MMKNLVYIQKYPWLTWLLYTMVTGIFYFSAAHWPLYSPFVVRPSGIDSFIPLWPPSAYIYITYFLLLPVLILLAHKQSLFVHVYSTALICGILNAAIFLVLPSSLDFRTAAPESSLLHLIQTLDSANSVIPSGHVALPFSIALACFIALQQSESRNARGFWKRMSFFYLAWALLISASTLLTRQHYMVDVLAGILFAALVSLFAPFPAAKRSGLQNSIALPTVVALAIEWVFIFLILLVTIRWWSWYTVIPGMLLLASRQHALLVLYHDAVHFLIASNKRLNDFIINASAGVPLQLPVHMYRALHLSHHKDLGTDADPEKVLLYRDQPWDYRPLNTSALLHQLAGDLFVINSLRMVWRYLGELRSQHRLKLTEMRFYPELLLMLLLFWISVAIAWYFAPETTLKVLVIWFGSYFTFTQLLQKIRSFAEHTSAEDDPELACSWSAGWLGRIFIWPYNINYHREHHKYAGIPWYRLPEVFAGTEQRKGNQLIEHLWKGNRA